MKQTRTHSLIESVTNIAVGAGVALASQLAIFPLFGIHVSMSTNLWITLWFTIISVVRSYFLRRWFTRLSFRPRPAATQAPAGPVRGSPITSTLCVPTSTGVTDGAQAIIDEANSGNWCLLAPDGRVWFKRDLLIFMAVISAELRGESAAFEGA